MGARLTSVLQDLKDQLGATAADLTSDEIEELVFACRKADSPFENIDAELAGRPIKVCDGVYMWPITAGAYLWLEEYASKWWKKGSKFYGWAQAFALINARKQNVFVNLTNKWDARKAVLKCSMRLVCHTGEVARAIDQAYGIDRFDVAPDMSKDKVREQARADFAAIVYRLEVASGISAEKWLWGKSIVSIMKSYVELTELSVAAFGSSGKAAGEAHKELDEAIENLARVCAKIGNRLRGKNDE